MFLVVMVVMVVFVIVLVLLVCILMVLFYEVFVLFVVQYYDVDDGWDGLLVFVIGWQVYFMDKCLQVLIGQVFENNCDLCIVVFCVEEVCVVFGIQWVEIFLYFDVQVGISCLSILVDLSLFGMFMCVIQYQVGVGVFSWEIDFWGCVCNFNDVVLESYVVFDVVCCVVVFGLIVQVVDSYLVLCELDECIVLVLQIVDSWIEILCIFLCCVVVGVILCLN